MEGTRSHHPDFQVPEEKWAFDCPRVLSSVPVLHVQCVLPDARVPLQRVPCPTYATWEIRLRNFSASCAACVLFAYAAWIGEGNFQATMSNDKWVFAIVRAFSGLRPFLVVER